MKRFNGTSRIWMKRFSAALLLTLAACGREGDFQRPPPQPPRPMTMKFGGGHASIAVLYLTARPALPQPGWM